MTAATAPSPTALLAAGRAPTAPAAAARPRPGLLARCGAWMRRLDEARALRGLEPRLARDFGAAPGGGGRGG